MERKSRISLRVSLAAMLIGTVLITSLLFGTSVFLLWRKASLDEINGSLGRLTGTTALLIDAEQHGRLATAADMETVTYRTLRDQLRAVRANNPEIRFLYTFRWAEGEEYPRFVLDSGDEGEDFSPLGEEYEDMTPVLEQAFEKPYRVKVEDGFYTDKYGTFLSAYAPILRPDGTLEAVVGLDIDAGWIVQSQRRLLGLIAGLTLLNLVLMALMSWIITRRMARPMVALCADMERIQQLELHGETPMGSRIIEIHKMERSLESMKKGLRSFEKYVPSDLVAELISMRQEAILGTVKRDVTIFFCDLEDFTSASEALASEDFNRLLSSYFETVSTTLQEHGATVDKYVGDAVMAFWGAPREMPDHALEGAKAVIAIGDRLGKLREEWRAAGLPALNTRIGLNSGAVLVGNVGHAKRLSYTVMGDPVNVASRLESLNKYYGTYVLAGEETLLAIEGRIRWRPVDRVAVKGKTRGTLIGELAAEEAAWWPEYRLAWEAYSRSEWKEAIALFEAVRRATGEDGPSRVLSERCRRFVDQGVPADWAGVWVMQAK